MRKTCLGLVLIAGLTSAAPARAEGGTAVGVGAGAVAGALVAGPVGAVIGAVAGGMIGATSADRPRAARRARAAVRRRHARALPLPRRAAMAEPSARIPAARPDTTDSTGASMVAAPSASGWKDPR